MKILGDLLHAWRWPLALIAICLITVWGGLRLMRMVVPGPFQKVDVTHRFISSFPEVKRTPGGLLEVAVVKVTETFTRSDAKTIGWIPLGETVSEIRVPITYRYHVPLSGNWNVRIDGQICRVIAPAIEPSLPPAVHLDEMERHADRRWARFDSSDSLQKLEQEVMKLVGARAAEIPKNFEVREACRRTTREFVEAWLVRTQDWHSDAFHIVDVRFRDEIGKTSEPRE